MSYPQTTSRWIPVLLAVALVTVVMCIWLLFSSAARLSDHRNRQTTATEFALTLTRLASALTAPGAAQAGADLMRSDQIARLVAMGDVQSKELVPEKTTVWFKFAGTSQLGSGAQALATHWSSIRNTVGELNSQSVGLTANEQSGGLAGTVALGEISRSFDALFDAITKDTLSVPLLRKVSHINADLDNLGFLLTLASRGDFANSIDQKISQLKDNVNQLKALSKRADGVSLLGYETKLLLQTFAEHISQPNLLAPGKSSRSLSNQQDSSAQSSSIQGQIIAALNQSEVYRRALDNAIHHYRRAILGALACTCAALLLSAILLLRIRRSGMAPTRKFPEQWQEQRPQQPSQEPPQHFAVMIADINELADGNLVNDVRSVDAESPLAIESNNIARAVNYTGKMMRSLVVVSRGIAAKTANVAQRQHEIAEGLMQVDNERRQHIVSLVEDIKQRTGNVQELCDLQSTANQESEQTTQASSESVDNVNAVMAAISAQVELGSSRIMRVVDTVNELSSMVEGIKSVAERSSLRALNSSIQMSAYGDSEQEDSQFVDEMQGMARRLAASASDAERLISTLKADAQAAGLALSGCTSAIEGGTETSMKVSQNISGVEQRARTLGGANIKLIEELTRQGESLHRVAEILCEIHDVDLENDKLLMLMESTLDLQLMATKLDNSLSHFKLTADETVAG